MFNGSVLSVLADKCKDSFTVRYLYINANNAICQSELNDCRHQSGANKFSAPLIVSRFILAASVTTFRHDDVSHVIRCDG